MLDGIRSVAVVGAAGRMGRWLCRLLVSEGINVLANDVSIDGLVKLKELIPEVRVCSLDRCVNESEAVVISVPIDVFEDTVKELSRYVRENHVVFDICSVKAVPTRLMRKYLKCLKLGTHPLFGPGTKSLANKVVALTPTSKEELNLALEVIKWLELRGAYGVVLDPIEHDKLMRLLIGIPHIIAIILLKLLSRYDLSITNLLRTPTFNFMLNYVSAIVAGNLEFSVNIHKHLNTIEELEELINITHEISKKMVKNPQELVNELLTISKKFSGTGVDINQAYKLMYLIFDENV